MSIILDKHGAMGKATQAIWYIGLCFTFTAHMCNMEGLIRTSDLYQIDLSFICANV